MLTVGVDQSSLVTTLANTSMCSLATTQSCVMVSTLVNSSQCCPMVATISTTLASRCMCSMSTMQSFTLVTNYSCLLASTQD